MIMYRYATVLLLTIAFCPGLSAQTITGYLPLLANQSIQLEGFNGMKTYLISSMTVDSSGHFVLSYAASDYGVGTLSTGDATPFILILSGEDIKIKGESLDYPSSISIIQGIENQCLQQYGKEHPRREKALSAWTFLEQIYTSDSLFSIEHATKTSIQNEIQRLQLEDASYLDRLPKDTYLRWYLPVRKLVGSVSTIAQYRNEEIPETIRAFQALDYAGTRLYKSGLLRDAVKSHFWLLANSGISLDSSSNQMKTSINAMMENLANDESKLNQVTSYLFDLLERHSFFEVSEYLALKLLNQTSCTIDSDLAKQLETYRAMKKGNIAPDIIFKGDLMAPGYETVDVPKKLSEISSSYALVVFGASWCPKCAEELPDLTKNYAKWRKQGMEVVYVSLDENSEAHRKFVKEFPFLSYCDYGKWESPIAKDYYVFATPSMYLLDRQRKIILRPTSVRQMDAWVDWNLVGGNK